MRKMVWGLLCLMLWIPLYSQNSQAPNIIFILTDDLGYGDLAHYGHRFIQTPHLDELARQGMTLTHFYAPSPLCSPSRAGMLTGRTPFRTGIKSWIPENDNIYLSNNEITIATLLKNKGYNTFLGGKWHLNGGLQNSQHPQPQDHGFDYWLGTHNFPLPTHKDPHNIFRNGQPLGEIEGFAAQIVVDEAMEWMQTVDKSDPFFMFISLHEPHSEIASPDSFNIFYKQFTEGTIDLENLSDRGPGEYYANISHMDFQVGRLLGKLDRLDLTDQTLVIFTSDNGPVTNQWRYWWEVNMYGETGGLRGRKADLFEGGLRVPCIIRYPGITKPGSISPEPVHGYDLLPTMAALAGVSLPDDRIIDGVDFSSILTGNQLNRQRPLFWAFEIRDYDDPNGYYYAARDGDWKMITDFDQDKTLLYNLKEDPYEVREVSSDHPQVVKRLQEFISEMAHSIEDDPLRPEHGPQSID
ncbi:MAG: sulfatase-like hydrolase/transferase [Cyclobacteriaceae bacterium]|nr:sulfatase-like hydrolase/transferase [Cyclobacteriaceae bacterium]